MYPLTSYDCITRIMELPPVEVRAWPRSQAVAVEGHHRSEIGWSLSHDDSEIAEVPAQRIDELGALAHEALVRSKRTAHA